MTKMKIDGGTSRHVLEIVYEKNDDGSVSRSSLAKVYENMVSKDYKDTPTGKALEKSLSDIVQTEKEYGDQDSIWVLKNIADFMNTFYSVNGTDEKIRDLNITFPDRNGHKNGHHNY